MQAAVDAPVPVKAVSSIYSKQPDAIFTVEGSGITSLKSLEGHSVATATFSSSNSLWPVLLSANNIDASSIKLIKVDPGALAPMLASGKIDGTINWLTVAPLMSSALQQAGKKLVVIPWSNYGLDGYGWSLMASDEMIKSRPDVLRRFLIAYRKATMAAIADPKVAGAALHAIVPIVDPEVATAQFAASIPLIKNEISEKDGIGNFDPALLKATWLWVAKSFNYPLQKIDPETLVNVSFIPKS
jgi:NitT/TauT family transport system substrate-binding protein